MNEVRRQNKVSRNFRLTNYTIQELQRLSELYKTSMTQIVELAVNQFAMKAAQTKSNKN